ncbi:MAG TPA: hypothetical protein VE890_08835 [Thermoguttaceae bacterium]|nr:hypothetical protein [Thermoguttaceae bacterium]
MHEDNTFTTITAITAHHRYTGELPSRGYRIADILNDSSTNVLKLHDAIASGSGVRVQDVRFDEVVLKKESVLIVIPQGKYEAPRRRRNRYIERDRYGAMVSLPGYILSGVIHLPTKPVPSFLLAENSTLPDFMGMTNVTVHSSMHDFTPTDCGVLIVRRSALEAVQLTTHALAKREDLAES